MITWLLTFYDEQLYAYKFYEYNNYEVALKDFKDVKLNWNKVRDIKLYKAEAIEGI